MKIVFKLAKPIQTHWKDNLLCLNHIKLVYIFRHRNEQWSSKEDAHKPQRYLTKDINA